MRVVGLGAIVEADVGGANWFGGRELGGRIFPLLDNKVIQ